MVNSYQIGKLHHKELLVSKKRSLIMNNIIYWLLQNNELKDIAGSRVVMDLVDECFQLNMAGSEVNKKTLIAQCSNHSERDIKEALDIYFKIKPMLNDLVSKIPVSIDLYLQAFKLGMAKIFLDNYAKIHKTDQETFKGQLLLRDQEINELRETKSTLEKRVKEEVSKNEELIKEIQELRQIKNKFENMTGKYEEAKETTKYLLDFHNKALEIIPKDLTEKIKKALLEEVEEGKLNQPKNK